jgi:hypothetical protein
LKTKDVLRISSAEISRVFNSELPTQLGQYVDSLDLQYEVLTNEEHRDLIMSIFDTIRNSPLETSGLHRQPQWTAGWAENLMNFRKYLLVQNLEPHYFKKHQVARWRQRFVRPTHPGFEAAMLSIIVRWVSHEYLNNVDTIMEFGCGTGRNLVDVRSINHNAELLGLDWATSSQEIVSLFAKKSGDEKLRSRYFDFFSPDSKLEFEGANGILTVASLEQTGKDYLVFLDYLTEKRPKICVHIEPIAELLDPNNILDFLSIEYFKRRNYLSGFLSELKKRELQQKLVIHKQMRTYSGSLFVDGHSIVVWSPT